MYTLKQELVARLLVVYDIRNERYGLDKKLQNILTNPQQVN